MVRDEFEEWMSALIRRFDSQGVRALRSIFSRCRRNETDTSILPGVWNALRFER